MFRIHNSSKKHHTNYAKNQNFKYQNFTKKMILKMIKLITKKITKIQINSLSK